MSSENVKNLLLKAGTLFVAACIWVPCAHLFFEVDVREFRTGSGIAPKVRRLAARHLAIWTNSELRARELAKMQQQNPEWDFMSRTFFVMALANMALRDQAYHKQACDIIDSIIEETLKTEEEKGTNHFLLAYAGTTGPWKIRPARSIFVDGEIALMMAARRMVEEKEEYKAPLADRVRLMIGRMGRSPVLSAESYPDECWMFCNTIALAAIRMADRLDGTDHSAFLSRWVQTARQKLTHKGTGILISSYAFDGTPAPSGFSPEGSTIWLAAHMLQIVDQEFAEDQYRRSHKELARTVVRFGYSREWPESAEGYADIDSGPIVPILDASASASGMAILGACSFEDKQYLSALLTSLNYAGFPVDDGKICAYQASNPVGDAVMLYALVTGPLWEKVNE